MSFAFDCSNTWNSWNGSRVISPNPENGLFAGAARLRVVHLPDTMAEIADVGQDRAAASRVPGSLHHGRSSGST